MVALDALGALERCPTFPRRLDIDAVADLELANPVLIAWWQENLELARVQDASPELISAIEACLAANREPAEPDVTGELREQLTEVEARTTELDRTLGEILSSRSWRLMAPLRRAGSVVRRLFGRS